MVLNYKVYLKDGVFKYDCPWYNSYLKISYKNIKKNIWHIKTIR